MSYNPFEKEEEIEESMDLEMIRDDLIAELKSINEYEAQVEMLDSEDMCDDPSGCENLGKLIERPSESTDLLRCAEHLPNIDAPIGDAEIAENLAYVRQRAEALGLIEVLQVKNQSPQASEHDADRAARRTTRYPGNAKQRRTARRAATRVRP